MEKLNYSDTLEYLFNRLPMFQRTGPAAYKDNLDNTLLLDRFYGHPHKSFKTIHVAGTNGKGSVSHMLASVFQSAGYKTGLYTSPHLKDFRERIRIDGKMIPEKQVVEWVEKFRINNELWKIEPSFFELTVALAFDYFAREKVDIAVVEVGLGGRLDSTNIIHPEVSVITNIGLDHTNLLGDTIRHIAGEKAGVIKEKVPVVIGRTQDEIKDVFIQKASEKNAPLFFAGREYQVEYATLGLDGKLNVRLKRNNFEVFPGLKLDLTGIYQQENVCTVLKTLEVLSEKGWNIPHEAIYKGLENTVNQTSLRGRWETIGYNPRIICDTGHNEDGIRQVVMQIKNTPFKKLHFVFGTVGDKSPDNVLKLLPREAVYYFTRADIPRAMNEEVLARKAADYGLTGKTFKTVAEALEAAKNAASANDLIFVGGSTFVVAEIL